MDKSTNVKTISEIIKMHKGRSYSDYINELRINYIVNKLYNNPEYLQYKVSYLAEDCGIGAYSSFRRTFTEIKKITPSKFIELLQESQN